MATVLIRNGFLAGALQGILGGRPVKSFTPGDYADMVNAADTFAGECITENTALGGAAMADADNANIFLVCMATGAAVMGGRPASSTTAADYTDLAKGAVAAAKQSVAKLT